MRRAGMALAEVMVSASVLLLMLGLASLALVAYLRGSHQLLFAPYPADANARMLGRTCQLLGSTQAWLLPARAELEAGYSPQASPLVVRVRTANGLAVRGLQFDATRGQLVELTYPDEFEVAHPTTQRAWGAASGFRVQINGANVVRIELQAGSQLPWSTSVVLP